MYAEHERQDWSIKGVIHRTLFRPFQMLVKEPILVLITIYLSVVYGLLYACESHIMSIPGDSRNLTCPASQCSRPSQ